MIQRKKPARCANVLGKGPHGSGSGALRTVLVPSLETVMRVASLLEAGWLELGMCDALVADRNATVSWGMSRMILEVRGLLP